jgi:hypothetical protein
MIFCKHQVDKLDQYMKNKVPVTTEREQHLSDLADAVGIIFWAGCDCHPNNKEVITVMGQPFSIKELEEIAMKRTELNTTTPYAE